MSKGSRNRSTKKFQDNYDSIFQKKDGKWFFNQPEILELVAIGYKFHLFSYGCKFGFCLSHKDFDEYSDGFENEVSVSISANSLKEAFEKLIHFGANYWYDILKNDEKYHWEK